MLFSVWGDATKTMTWLIRIGTAMALFAFVMTMAIQAQTKPAKPEISGIAFVRIGVGDLEKAKSFYNGELRLPTLTSTCFDQDTDCFFINPDQRLALAKTMSAKTSNLIQMIGLRTTDASALRKYLLAKGQQPEEIITDSEYRITFQIKDPEGHLLEFVQPTKGFAGSMSGIPPISRRMIHAGFIVKDRAAMDKFYRDILGFHLYWQGGMKDGETSWVSMQVPDGTDWIEFMLHIDPNADQHLRGVMNHIALGVPSVKAAAIQLEKSGVKPTEQPKIGRDGKWQLNLYDPDLTRVELMEFTPVEKPCCSEFTGTHPKP